MPNLIQREQPVLSYLKNNRRSDSLPRDRYVKEINLDVEGSVQFGTAGTVVEDNPLTLIEEVVISLAGNSPIKRIKPVLAFYKSMYERGKLGTLDAVAAGTAAQTFRFNLPIQFSSAMARNRAAMFRSLFPAFGADSMNITVHWNDHLQLHSGSPVLTSLEASAMPCLVEYPQDVLPPLSAKMADDMLVCYEDWTRVPITQSGEVKVKLEENVWQKSLILYGVDNGARSNTLIDELRFHKGGDDDVGVGWKRLQRRNEHVYGVAPVDGVNFMDFDPEGDIRKKDLVDLNGVNEPALFLKANTPTSGAYVLVGREYYIPLSRLAKR